MKDYTEEYYDEQRELEMVCDFTEGLKYSHKFKKEYPDLKADSDFYYIDQAPSRVDLRGVRGPNISSAFTIHGIRQMDAWISKQITGKSKFTNKELEKMIKHNFHLHNVVKTNLLDNLKNKKNGI